MTGKFEIKRPRHTLNFRKVLALIPFTKSFAVRVQWQSVRTSLQMYYSMMSSKKIIRARAPIHSFLPPIDLSTLFLSWGGLRSPHDRNNLEKYRLALSGSLVIQMFFFRPQGLHPLRFFQMATVSLHLFHKFLELQIIVF